VRQANKHKIAHRSEKLFAHDSDFTSPGLSERAGYRAVKPRMPPTFANRKERGFSSLLSCLGLALPPFGSRLREENGKSDVP
jgi:hypothetical protein